MKKLFIVSFMLLLSACANNNSITPEGKQNVISSSNGLKDVAQVREDPIILLENDASAPFTILREADKLVRGDGGGAATNFHCGKNNLPLADGSYTSQCIDVYGYNTKLEIIHNGKRQSLYEKVIDGAFSEDGQYLALHNGVRQDDGRFLEQMRIIHISTQTSVQIPLEKCTDNVMGWSQGRLITASYNQSAAGPSQTIVCSWNTTGKLLNTVKVQGLDFNNGGPTNRIAFLPAEKNALYIVRPSSGINVPKRGGDPDCQIAALDLDNPSRTTLVTFNAGQGSASCAPEEIELDLKEFTIESPSFRFRIHQNTYDPDNRAWQSISVGSWQQWSSQ